MRIKKKIRTSLSQKQKIRRTILYTVWSVAIVGLVGVAIFLSLNLGIFEDLFAGSTFNTTTTGGNWATGSTWVGGSAPASWANNTANIYGDVTLTSSTTSINGYTLITLNNGKSFTSGSVSTSNSLYLQQVTFNVISGDITVYGNLTLDNSSLTITSGNLTVTGTLTLTNSASLTFNSSGTITANAVTTGGSGGTLNLNSGSLAITTSLTINSSSTISVASGTSLSAASLTVSSSNSAILNNAGLTTINGNVSSDGVINNNSGGTMQINGNYSSSGSGNSILTNTGTLNITGNVTVPSSAKFKVNPGGSTVVNGSVNVGSNTNLVVGTNASPPPYADLVIKQNLVASSSGDVLFDKNSRVAIYGNVTDSGGGGTLFTVNNGGQVYVNGNISYSGGGSAITNNNTTNPYGLYVNGTITNSGGGATTTGNKASKAVMQSTNAPFYAWVASLSGSPLPITLVYFRLEEGTPNQVTLTWATAMEKNFDKFIIERSLNGNEFEPVGEIKGAGNSKTLLNYAYNDTNPLIGVNYYRLKFVDLDESFEYSKNVVSATVESAKEFTIYPNPNNGTMVNFKTNFDAQEDDVVSVINLSGTEIARNRVSGNDNKLKFQETLKPGAYIIKYSSEKFHLEKRMVVQAN